MDKNVDIFLANLESFNAYAVFRPLNYYGIEKGSLKVAGEINQTLIEKTLLQILETQIDDEENEESSKEIEDELFNEKNDNTLLILEIIASIVSLALFVEVDICYINIKIKER